MTNTTVTAISCVTTKTKTGDDDHDQDYDHKEEGGDAYLNNVIRSNANASDNDHASYKGP